MNEKRLKEYVKDYAQKLGSGSVQMLEDMKDRAERKVFFQSATRDRILSFTPQEFGAYMSRLWAMLVWGNKEYYLDKIITANGFDQVKTELAELVWGDAPVAVRWDRFKATCKMIGPAMMSEILAHVHPTDCMVWNRRAYVGLDYLGVPDLPKYNYQVTGDKYTDLCSTAKSIAEALRQARIF